MHQRGIIDKEDLDAWTKAVVGLLRTPGGAQHWASTKAMYTPAIVDYLDKEIIAAEGEPSWVEAFPYYDSTFDDALKEAGRQSEQSPAIDV